MKDTFDEIFIPEAVHEEILRGREFGGPDVPVIENSITTGWIKILKVHVAKTEFSDDLGDGEKEAITLALQKQGKDVNWLLLDDELAAKTARSLGLTVRATSYLPIYWSRKGTVRPSEALGMLDSLVREGYRLSIEDYVVIKERILETNSEG